MEGHSAVARAACPLPLHRAQSNLARLHPDPFRPGFDLSLEDGSGDNLF